jgi:hypothetical protein
VSLKRELQAIHRERTGRDLLYMSCARFDQQVTTKFHRDGGPDESMLMLGYEPSEVSSSLALADYAKCAFRLGITPGEFLERHNPMFAAGMDLLAPYVTPLTSFEHRHSQILLINNSMAPYEEQTPRWQGVLHTAEIIDPCESKRRVINSTMLASEPLGTSEPVTHEQQAEFIRTTLVRRSGYDKPLLADDP